MLKLGQSTNLLDGYKPCIYLNDLGNSPINPSTKLGLHTLEANVTTPDDKAKWELPLISLHATKEELVTALIQLKIKPETCEKQQEQVDGVACWPTGALVLETRDAEMHNQTLRELSEQLGIDLTSENLSYVLVRRTRKIGVAIHPNYANDESRNTNIGDILTPEALEAIKKLQKLSKSKPEFNLEGARGYLDFYNTFGSHFISKIEVGDTLFQVFSYGKEAFEYLNIIYSKHPRGLSGENSSTFALYTTPRKGEYGFTNEIGNICISSKDQAMDLSIRDGAWVDSEYSLKNSIFTPLLVPNSVDVDKLLKKNTVIGIELVSINVFAEYYRKLIWRRIFKAAMYCLYWRSPNIAPFFNNDCPYDLEEIYKNSDVIGGDGLLSNLATPTLSIFKEKLDLSSIAIQFPNLVKVMSAFSNAIVFSTTDKRLIELPGSNLVTLVSHIISAPAVGRTPLRVSVSEKGFDELKTNLYCGEFYGACHVTSGNSKKSLIIMNGLIFEEVKRKVSICCDTRVSPPLQLLEKYTDDLQISLVASEARLGYLLNSKSAFNGKSWEVLRNYFRWLGGIPGLEKGSTEKSETIVALQARALYLADLSGRNEGPGLPIPFLKYDAYRDSINTIQNVLITVNQKIDTFQNQIRSRKEEERRLQSDKAINENIIKTGKLLLDYIRTQATYQNSLEVEYDTIYNEKQRNINKLTKRVDELDKKISEQRTEVNKQIRAYHAAVIEWKRDQTLSAALDIAAGLFTTIVGFATPVTAIAELASLGAAAQHIQKAFNVLKALSETYKAYNELPSNPQNVVDSITSIDSKTFQLPNKTEWEEMHIKMERCLNFGPDVSAKYGVSDAFAILVLRGKALIEVQNQLQTELSELAAASRRSRLHKEQMDRLNKLQIKLDSAPEDLDVDAIDLVGLSGKLLLFQRHMLIILASTILIQDRALQYEYLRPPTPISSFTLMDLQYVLTIQSNSILNGLTVQPTPQLQSTPIIYEIHGVHPSKIINNKRYSFDIQISAREFASFNYVRVDSVTAEIGGIESTKSGKYYIELYYSGQPFYDRDFNGKPLTFQTSQRMYTSSPNVSDCSHFIDETEPLKTTPAETIHITGPQQGKFGEMVSQITPFSSWQIALPPTQINEGIKFANSQRGLTVRLIFHIFAQLLDKEKNTPQQRIQRAMSLRNVMYPNVQMLASIPPSDETPSNSSTPPPTNVETSDILEKQMKDQSVCMGWDVVFSMDEVHINKSFEQQFSDRQNNPDFLRDTGPIKTEPLTHDNGSQTKTEFEFKFNAPKLQFYQNNSDSAQICFPIISGTYKRFYKSKTEDNFEVEDSRTITQEQKAFVKGDVKLDKLIGKLTSDHHVVINLKEGAFTTQNFLPSGLDDLLDARLTKYFTTLPDNYQIYKLGTLNLENHLLLPSLIPTSFKFAVYNTESHRNFLQLYIATTGEPRLHAHMNLTEPVPSNFENSLIVNSKIVFSKLIPFYLKNPEYNLSLKGVEPSDDVKQENVWTAEIDSGQISAHFEPIILHSKEVGERNRRYILEDYIKLENDHIQVDLTSTKFSSGDNSNLKMDLNKEDLHYTFLHGRRKKGTDIKAWEDTYHIVMSVKMNASFIISVTETRQQTLQMQPKLSDPDVTYQVDNGSCTCDANRMREKVNDRYKESIKPVLNSMLEKDFPSISLFALKNLLFPNKDLIDFQEAYIPGDLVVFGNFTDGTK